MSYWKWHVRGFYSSTVEDPKVPESLAIEVGGLSKEALSTDILVLKNREDIGRIFLVHPNGYEEELVK